MATQSNILAWRIPWTEEPGGLQYTGSQRVGHDRATSLPSKTVNIKRKNSAFFKRNSIEIKSGGVLSCLSIVAAAAKSLQLCPTLCDPIDGSPQPVPGILQAQFPYQGSNPGPQQSKCQVLTTGSPPGLVSSWI